MKILPAAFVYSLKSDNLEEFVRLVKEANIDFRKGGPNSGTGSSGKQNKLLSEIMEAIDKKIKIVMMIDSFKISNK